MVDTYVRDDYYHQDNSAWWKTGLTLLSLALFFAIGWFSNDLYQNNNMQSTTEQEFGIGGSPFGPSSSPLLLTPTPTSTPVPGIEP